MPAASSNGRTVAGLAWLGLGSLAAHEHVREGLNVGAKAEQGSSCGQAPERRGRMIYLAGLLEIEQVGRGERELKSKWIKVVRQLKELKRWG